MGLRGLVPRPRKFSKIHRNQDLENEGLIANRVTASRCVVIALPFCSSLHTSL